MSWELISNKKFNCLCLSSCYFLLLVCSSSSSLLWLFSSFSSPRSFFCHTTSSSSFFCFFRVRSCLSWFYNSLITDPFLRQLVHALFPLQDSLVPSPSIFLTDHLFYQTLPATPSSNFLSSSLLVLVEELTPSFVVPTTLSLAPFTFSFTLSTISLIIFRYPTRY